MKAVLQTLFVSLRDLAIAIQPVVPEKAAALLDQLGIPEGERSYSALADADWFNRLVANGFTVAPPTALFPPARIARRGRGHLMLIDSHCHLEYKGLVEDQAEVLARAREAGVGAFLNISTRQSEWAQVVGTAAREPDVFASVGIHPHEADAHQDLGRAALLEATHHPRVIAIGETGLDLLLRQIGQGHPETPVPHAYRRRARDAVTAHHPHPRCRGVIPTQSSPMSWGRGPSRR